jgi:hypothetical protein
VPQDPAVIQSQIEETRAELAETIDAIAELVSPRRVAERAGEQARAKLAELRARAGHHGGQPLEIGARAAGGAGSSVAAPTPHAAPGEAGVTRSVRWGRVALAAGATMLLVVSTTRRRRRHRG